MPTYKETHLLREYIIHPASRVLRSIAKLALGISSKLPPAPLCPTALRLQGPIAQIILRQGGQSAALCLVDCRLFPCLDRGGLAVCGCCDRSVLLARDGLVETRKGTSAKK
jgi:hypothetical protein